MNGLTKVIPPVVLVQRDPEPLGKRPRDPPGFLGTL